MLFNTHVKIGSLLHAWFEDSCACRLPRQAFLYGNIKPDLERHGEEDRHLIENSRGWISQQLALLREEAQKPLVRRDSIRMGILAGEICHHMSDAFCRYHDEASLYTDFRHHFLYELGLHRRFLRLGKEGRLHSFLLSIENKKGNQHGWPNVVDVMVGLYTGLQDYHESPPSHDLDIQCALRCCARTMILLSPMLSLATSTEFMSQFDGTKLPAFAQLFQQERKDVFFPGRSNRIFPGRANRIFPGRSDWLQGSEAALPLSASLMFDDEREMDPMAWHRDTLVEGMEWRNAL